MIHIPQTCWDLFVLHNDYRRMLPISGVTFLKSTDFVDLSNDFVNHILNNDTLLDHYKNRRYSDISGIFISEIRSHINKYNTTIEKIFFMKGESDNDYQTSLKVFGHTDTLFPEIEQLLVKATTIEQDCYEMDQFPLWRHSRTSLKLPLEGNLNPLENIIIDLPIYQMITEDYNPHKTSKKLGIGTLCYGFSLLADFMGDGAIADLGNFKTTSACTISYFMTELLSHKYASGVEFPFNLFEWYDREEVRNSMKNETFTVSVTRLPKLSNAHMSMNDALEKSWFIPEKISANNWITSRGEKSHPRHKGTHLNRIEQKTKIFRITNIWNDDMLIPVLKEFLAETKNMEILVLNSQVCETPELQQTCTQLILDRQRVSNIILDRDDAADILNKFVLATDDGSRFY